MRYYQDDHILIRPMSTTDPTYFAAEERKQGWHSTPAKLERRLRDERDGLCLTFVAEYGGLPAGYVSLYLHPTTGAFANQSIPEIVDFAVLETFRRHGIGGRLMDTAERAASKWCE